jgi:RimJ/RimL family protein N-acetyltransferase
MMFRSQLFQSQNLVLQAYDPEQDAQAEASFSYDPNYARVIEDGIPHPLTVFEVKKKREEELKKNAGKDNFFLFGIHRKLDGAFIGTLCFPDVFWFNRFAYFMLAVGDPEMQEAYFPEALQLALMYGLEELGLYSVYTTSGDFDPLTFRALVAAGFKPVVCQRENAFRNGRVWDVFYMEMLQSDLTSNLREVQK